MSKIERAWRDRILDPLFVANEGKLVAMVAEPSASVVPGAMRRVPEGRDR